MGTVLLFLLFLVLTIVSYRIFDSEIIHPAVIFCALFCVALLTGLLNYDAWNFDLNALTVLVVGAGGIVFVAVCLLVKTITVRSGRTSSHASLLRQGPAKLSMIRVPKWFSLVCMAVSVVLLYLVAKAMITATAPYGGSGGILSAISVSNSVSKFSDQLLVLPVFQTQAFVFLQALAFIWIYVFIYNLSVARHVDVLVLLNAAICGVSPIMSGSRGPIFLEIIACIVIAILISNAKHMNVNRSASRLRTLIAVAVLVVVALVVFEPLLSLMGRTSNAQSLNQYLSVYLGAPIKNLDTFLSVESASSLSPAGHSRWGEISFANLYLFFDKAGNGAVATNWAAWFPFQTINNESLGNVYTVYYPLIYDWGLFGALFGIAVIAACAQISFDVASGNAWSDAFPVRISYLFYSVVAYGVAFCFFSNWITSTIVNTQFVRFLIVWFVFSWLIGRFQTQQVGSRRRLRSRLYRRRASAN